MHDEKCSKIWSWWIPALLALVSVLGMWGVYEMMFAMREAADISGEGMDAGPLLMMSFLLLLLFFVYGLVWLVVSIVICVRQRCWWSLLGRLALVSATWNVWGGVYCSWSCSGREAVLIPLRIICSCRQGVSWCARAVWMGQMLPRKMLVLPG